MPIRPGLRIFYRGAVLDCSSVSGWYDHGHRLTTTRLFRSLRSGDEHK
jgi:hypothetical protein